MKKSCRNVKSFRKTFKNACICIIFNLTIYMKKSYGYFYNKINASEHMNVVRLGPDIHIYHNAMKKLAHGH